MVANGTAEKPPILRIDGISKHFSAVRALEDIQFEVHAAEVVALLGDNGAGKSTLIKIIAGEIRPDSGQILFDGRPVRIETPAQAKALGIETVYQDLSLCPNVDVVANFFMGRELRRRVLGLPILDEQRMRVETEHALAEIGAVIPSVKTDVAHLSGGQRQAIELCRFLHWGGKLAMLDEPFAALGVAQTQKGLDLIQRVKDRGVAVMVITHNLLHAFRVADRMVVLRQGRVAGIRPASETTPDEIVALITGEGCRLEAEGKLGA